MDVSIHAKNDDLFNMTLLLEILDEHAVSLDFGMFLIIWLVQVIIYPVFLQVKESEFVAWHHGYCNAIGFFVLPVMSLQLIETASTCFFSGGYLSIAKIGSVIGAWIVTFLCSAPYHKKLQKGKDFDVISRLIRTNWIRTILWSLAFVLSVFSYYK